MNEPTSSQPSSAAPRATSGEQAANANRLSTGDALLPKALSDLKRDIVADISAVIEERTVQGNAATRAALKELLDAALGPITSALRRLETAGAGLGTSPSAAPPPVAAASAVVALSSAIRAAGGSLGPSSAAPLPAAAPVVFPPVVFPRESTGSAIRHMETGASAAPPSAVAAVVTPRESTFLCHEWAGKIRRAPQDFELPLCNLRSGFSHYCLPDLSKKVPALRRLCAVDVGDDSIPEQKARKRKLAEYQALYGLMKSHLEANNRWVEEPSPAQVNEMFDLAVGCLGISEKTPTGRLRRLDEIAWSTVARELRETEESRECRRLNRKKRRSEPTSAPEVAAAKSARTTSS